MAVLVTGVGYIGAALAARLLRAGERVVALDNGFATNLAAVAGLGELGDFELVEGSVSSPRAVARAFRRGPFATVYHLAAQASGYVAPRYPRYTETTNLIGPRVVLDAAARHKVPRVVYGSSFRVYGPVLPLVVDETTPYGPQGDLAHLSHVYGEKLLELYGSRHGLIAVALRAAVVYGIGPVTKTDYRYTTVPNKYCLQAVRGEPLVVYPGAATPTAFIHVDDACAALMAAAAAPWPPGFHVATAAGEVCTVPEVAALVADAGRPRDLTVIITPLEPSGVHRGSPGGGGFASSAGGQSAWRLQYSAPQGLQYPTPHSAGGGGGIPPAWSSPSKSPEGVGGVPPLSPRLGTGGAGLPVIRSRLTALGWKPTRSLADSVGEMLDYFRVRERA